MATPIAEDMLNTLVERVKDGTYTSPYQIKKVIRPNRLQTNAPVGHLECRVVMSGGEPNEAYTHDGNPVAQGYTFHFDIAVFVMLEESDERPLDQVMLILWSDITKAITIPNDTWFHIGGKAIDATYEWVMGSSNDGAVPAAIVTVHANTRFDIHDPTQIRP